MLRGTTLKVEVAEGHMGQQDLTLTINIIQATSKEIEEALELLGFARGTTIKARE